MNIGDLNRRIEIMHFTEVIDEIYGPQPGEWATLAKTWASIKHLSGLATVKQGAAFSEVKASIRIRYRPDIDSTMQIKHGNTYYEINAVMPQGKEYLDLVCSTTEQDNDY